MNVEFPYEIEWPLLRTMVTRAVALDDAARILGVSSPTALTLLQHLESIGLVWQLPRDACPDHSIRSRDWEITPAGRVMAGDRAAPEGEPVRVVTRHLWQVPAA